MTDVPINSYGAVLLTIRIVFHFLTLASILCWMSDHRTKWFSSLLAFVIAGGSFAAAMQGMTQFATLAPHTEFPFLLLTVAWAILTIANGGNVAKVLHSAGKPFGFIK